MPWFSSLVRRKLANRSVSRPRLEVLESRYAPSATPSAAGLALSSLATFDSANGLLSLVGNTDQINVNKNGGIAVTVDGQSYALGGATASTLHQIKAIGSLILSGDLQSSGFLAITASSLVLDGAISAGTLSLSSSGTLTLENGSSLGAGSIVATADYFVNVGQITATAGGKVAITARNYLDSGTISAVGGSIAVNFTGSYIDTASALTTASSSAAGGQVTINGGTTGRLFSSGTVAAKGSRGGSITLLGQNILLIADNLDASGQNGRIYVMSDVSTDFKGTATAEGGRGYIEISSHGQLTYSGHADAGKGGTLLLDPKYLVISSTTGVSPQYSLVNPGSGGTFGSSVVSLSTGNIVVTDPTVNNNVGAVYLFNGATGALISTLTGSTAGTNGDKIGTSITPLKNGNFVISSTQWNGGLGAATWASGTSGVSGTISASNSLVGSFANDHVGSLVTALTNGNYVVGSMNWNGSAGAATWGSGTTGVDGTISFANSLVGVAANDAVGSNVIALTNGNYVVSSFDWAGTDGAATWGNGASGISGIISISNSLIGTAPGDFVGAGITPLANGNYVVASPDWNSKAGAATWGNGASGISGTISSANSLVGSLANDQAGLGVIALSNNNYVVTSQFWNGNIGAATWANGTTGLVGAVSAANSLVGSTAGDNVGGYAVALTNGNYVVSSNHWNNSVGAATWGNGTTGTKGTVSAANSLVGSTGGLNTGDQIGTDVVALTNGNYVVGSPLWNNARGAVTWGNGKTGATGAVSGGNSLVGTTGGGAGVGDEVGSNHITALTNGNYVVSSPSWGGGKGAVTWANGASGFAGTISAFSSVIGSSATDSVGNPGVVALTNGNYVIASSLWNNGTGAATLGNGTKGTAGTISATNSLIGNTLAANDLVASGPIVALSNGNYVVTSPNWSSNVGAATWVNGTTGTTLDAINTPDAQNSILGTAASTGLTVVPGTVAGSFVAAEPKLNGGQVIVGITDPNQLTYSLAQSETVTITPAFLTRSLNAGTNVTLQASDDITINSPITVTATGTAGNLTLQAGRSIFINANISTGNGTLTMIANDLKSNGVVDSQRDTGNAAITMEPGTTITTGTGSLYVYLFNSTDKTNHGSGIITMAGITSPSVTIFLPTGTNSLTLNPGNGSFSGTTAAIIFASVNTVNVIGTSTDIAYLYDTKGQNAFVGSPTYSFFEGTGFYNQAVGFQAVNAYAATGSYDTAYLYDAGGNNVYVGTPSYSYMQGTAYFNQAIGFTASNAYATQTSSNDAAYLFDNGGTNTFVGTSTYSYLQGSGYFDQAIAFKSVTVTGASGANDTAYLFGAASGNVFNGSSTFSYMYGTGYLNEAIGFKNVSATGTATDTATLYDGKGTNTFTGQGSSGYITVSGISYSANSFGFVNIVQSEGSYDTAVVKSITYTLTKSGTWH